MIELTEEQLIHTHTVPTLQNLTFNISFYGRENVKIGRLYEKDGKLHFEGDIDQSAELFFDSVINKWLSNRSVK